MHGIRQGMCENCGHEVIDSRDLKLWRNVCGYWFQADDSVHLYRSRFGLARAGLAEVAFSSLLALISLTGLSAWAYAAEQSWLWLAGIPIAYLWFHALRFFRDPVRATPDNPRALVSPSDGVITDMHEVDDADFPGRRAFRVSIYLSPWDVHLNRNPIDATVAAVRYFPGRFLNARHEKCAIQNEQLWVDLERGGRVIRIKQISGAMARRLVCWLKPGDQVRVGERYGMIKFGSRSDILVSADDEFVVALKVGDRVYAGESVILEFAGE